MRRLAQEPIAWALALIILIRPWIDGITWPLYNTYFLWVLVFLFALWATSLLFGRTTIHFEKAGLLLAAFLAVAALTGLGTVQKDATYRALLMWVGYGCAFMLAANGLRTRTAIAIVMSAFVTVSFAEALFSLVHFRYSVPSVRVQVMQNPSLLRSYFGADILTAELAHRLNVNRAFGSLLFPNALAAFLILGIPYFMADTLCAFPALSRALRTWRRQAASGKESTAPNPGGWRRHLTQLAVSAAVGGVAACLVYGVLGVLLLPYVEKLAFVHNETWYKHGFTVAFCRYVAPVGVGTSIWWIARRYGLEMLGLILRATFAPLTLVLELGCLWLTYSRGGVLALTGALAMAGALLWFSRNRNAPSRRPAPRAIHAGILIVGLGLALALNAHGVADTELLTQETRIPGGAQTLQPVLPAAPGVDIQPEGINLTVKDLLNPSSFWLRMSYWGTGLRILRDNFWTGVGLGNFGTIYPKYQYLGAGDVKQAHNDYLQVFCETGLFGFLLFVAFWLYFLGWGARHILREKRPSERWLLAGLYTGVLAFLIQQLVDFGFANPSLAVFEFLLAGLFFARVGTDLPDKPRTAVHQVVAVPLLTLAALVAGVSVRMHYADTLVGTLMVENKRYTAARFFLDHVDPTTYKPGQPPTYDAGLVLALIPDQALLKNFGTFMAPKSGAGIGDVVFVVRDPQRARQEARKAIEQRILVLKRADGWYEQNPQAALYLFQWYDLLQAHAQDQQEKQRYVLQCLEWAEEAVARSPQQAWYREALAKALWYRANIETGPGGTRFFRRGLDEYRQMTTLYPISPLMWEYYGQALMEYGNALKRAGDAAGAEVKLAEARRALETAAKLHKGTQ